jgi:hypothetical protein
MTLAHDEMFNGFFIVNGQHWLAAVQQYGFSKHRTAKDVFEYVNGKFCIFNLQYSLGTHTIRHDRLLINPSPPPNKRTLNDVYAKVATFSTQPIIIPFYL